MASNDSQIATFPQVNMDEFSQLMKEQLQTKEAKDAEQQLETIFGEFGEKLNGKTLPEVVSADDFDAQKAMELLPDSIIANVANDSGVAEEDIRVNFLKTFEVLLNAKDIFRSMLDPSVEAAEPDEIKGVKRVQTMLPDQDVNTMKFDPVEKLTELLKPLGLDDAQKVDSNVNPEAIFKSLAVPANFPCIKIPVANPELANKNFGEYRKHADSFITAMDDSNAALETLAASMSTLRSFPLYFDFLLEATREDVRPIIEKIQEVLANMEEIHVIRKGPQLKPILAALLSQEDIEKLKENLLSSADLKAKWDEIEKAIDDLIEKHNEAEAEAEAEEAEKLSADLD